jgi:tRNA threonylcarbamoyladenosine biosynthesis protein TsaB
VRLLALDTATRHATVALAIWEAPGLLVEREREVTTHSDVLLVLVDEVLREADLRAADLDAVVCGRGPGSFTGLRIGLATAKGICLAAGKKLLCLSSLLPLGRAAAEAAPAGQLCAAVLDARRAEVYYAFFRDGAALGPEALARPAQLAGELGRRGEPVLLCGDGALLYRDELLAGGGERARLAPPGCHEIRARHLLEAARPRLEAGEADDLAAVVPTYIRPSDARLPGGGDGRAER